MAEEELPTMTAKSIEDLPNELIITIMSYLPVCTRKQTRLVCKQWNELSYTTKLISNDVTEVNTISDLNQISSNTKHINVIVKNLDASEEESNFWEIHGSHIKSVELYFADLNNPLLVHIFKHCKNVENVVFSERHIKLDYRVTNLKRYSEPLDVSEISTPKLLGLHLEYIQDFDKPILAALTSKAEKLCSMGVSHVDFGGQLDWSNVVHIVNRQKDVITELSFTVARLPYEVYEAIFSNIGKQLKELHLDYYSFRPLWPYREKLLQVENLSLPLRNDQDFYFLLGGSKLKRISLCNEDLCMEAASLRDFINAENLTAINFHDCDSLLAADLIAIFGAKLCPQMIDLRLDKIECVDGNVLTKICPMLPNLKYLSLNRCHLLTHDDLVPIYTNNIKLQYLKLSSCAYISSITSTSPNINDLKGLRHLEISGTEIKEQSIREICLFHLEYLNIGLLDVGIGDLSYIFKNCPSLYAIGGFPTGSRPRREWILENERKITFFKFSPTNPHRLLFSPSIFETRP